MPIGNPEKTFQGVRINNRTRSNLIYLAKNVVYRPITLFRTDTAAVFRFRDALQLLLEPGDYNDKFNNKYPIYEDKQSAIRRLEETYYEAAFALLAEITDEAGMINFEGDPIEENVELRRVLAQKKEIK